jgi:hypothetical protein
MLGPSFVIPTPAEEEADPSAADDLYGSAVDELRRRAKLTKNRAVHRENISYGFTRNLLALKPVGVGIGVLGLALLAAVVFYRGGRTVDAVGPHIAALAIFLALDVAAWLILIRPSLVFHHAEAYALALLEFAESIQAPSKSQNAATQRATQRQKPAPKS